MAENVLDGITCKTFADDYPRLTARFSGFESALVRSLNMNAVHTGLRFTIVLLTNALFLPTGKRHTTFAHSRFIPLRTGRNIPTRRNHRRAISHLRKRHDEVMRIRHLGRSMHVILAGRLATEQDVLSDGGLKQHGLLADHADVLPQPGEIVLADFRAIDKHSSCLVVVESLQELYAGRFARTRRADDGNCLAVLHVEGEAVEHTHLRSRRVREVNVGELNIANETLAFDARVFITVDARWLEETEAPMYERTMEILAYLVDYTPDDGGSYACLNDGLKERTGLFQTEHTHVNTHEDLQNNIHEFPQLTPHPHREHIANAVVFLAHQLRPIPEAYDQRVDERRRRLQRIPNANME